MLGHSTLEVICFVVIWALQLLIISAALETVRRFQDWSRTHAVWLMMLILAIYLCIATASRSPPIPQDVLLEDQGGQRARRARHSRRCAPSPRPGSPIRALYLNFCDYSRYALKRQRAAGQYLGPAGQGAVQER